MVLPIMSEAMTGMRQLQGRVSLWLLRLSSKLEQIQADTKKLAFNRELLLFGKNYLFFLPTPKFSFWARVIFVKPSFLKWLSR